MADLLEIEGANPFRVRAYRNAARIIGGQSRSVAEMVGQGEDLTMLPGIGKDLAEKIHEIVRTGSLSQLKELESRTPPELSRLMKIAGLGPKRVKILYEKLRIASLEELKSESAKAWEKLKAEIDAAVDELNKQYDKMVARLKKT